MVARMDDAAAMAKLRASLKVADSAAKRAVTKTFNGAAEPFKAEFASGARSDLPKRGGFAEIVATAKISVRRRLGGKNPSLWLIATRAKVGGKIDLRSVNRGRLRHPVRQRKAEMAAGRTVWVSQEIPAGFFDDVCTKAGEETTTRMRLALQQSVAEVSD